MSNNNLNREKEALKRKRIKRNLYVIDSCIHLIISIYFGIIYMSTAEVIEFLVIEFFIYLSYVSSMYCISNFYRIQIYTKNPGKY